MAKLFKDAGIITLVSFIAPLEEMRLQAKEIINDNFYEIYVKADVKECINRDPKGLYKKALTGEILEFTGISSPYEEPKAAHLVLDTNLFDLYHCTKQLEEFIHDKIKIL